MVSELLLPLLQRDEPGLALEALRAMSRQMPERGFSTPAELAEQLPSLLRLLEDPSVRARRLSALCLSRIPAPRLVAFLDSISGPMRRALTDRDVGVRRAAIRGLLPLLGARPSVSGPDLLVDAVERAREDPDPIVRRLAASGPGEP